MPNRASTSLPDAILSSDPLPLAGFNPLEVVGGVVVAEVEPDAFDEVVPAQRVAGGELLGRATAGGQGQVGRRDLEELPHE